MEKLGGESELDGPEKSKFPREICAINQTWWLRMIIRFGQSSESHSFPLPLTGSLSVCILDAVMHHYPALGCRVALGAICCRPCCI